MDDLADFLQHPPGTRPERPTAAGWVALTGSAAAPDAAPARGAGHRRRPSAAPCLAGLALVATVAAVAAVAAGSGRGDPRATPARTEAPADVQPARGRTEGRLTAGGLVLQQRAVGVTATYPEVRLSTAGDTADVEVHLPTWNCLTADAPDDPAAAGCARSLVEHGGLASPHLVVERDGSRVRLHGRVSTWIHPAGSVPEPTGRTYELDLTVAPGRPGGGNASTAVGEIRIGEGTAPLVEELSELFPG